jgi:aminoglycoside 6-adenylyltransferase
MTVEAFLEQITAWAGEQPDVRAVFLVGSQARRVVPADELSDVDLVLVVDDPAAYVESAGWLEAFGRPLLTFFEPTPLGGLVERRVLFDSGLEVDFNLAPAAGMTALLADPEAMAVVARGYRILHDELGLGTGFANAASVESNALTACQLAQLSHDFWYHALWAAKKLRRGETYVAKQACDGYLKSLLVQLLTINARTSGVDTWHQGRFLERWAAPADLVELGASYAHYDSADIARAIKATAAMFERLERELADHLGVGPVVDHSEVVRRLEVLLGPCPISESGSTPA